MADIEIEIDGKKLNAQPNQTVIQVADAAGIYIPRFCYHKHLSVPANCRMCLVEVEKSPKAVPACATPVMSGMKVFTQSQKTLAAQRAVMEFLLINHPLDCPICDQGGECELQDLAMGYGASASHYNECKRAIADENLGPLIATDMTRCISCTRCVRFGREIAGLSELGQTYRGEDVEISTYVQHAMKSEISGNIIDVCPVGALTSKPYRFTARAWELDQAPGISPHDCLGSHLNIHTRYGEVKRVVSRENPAINETWIADRDRFSYTSLYHPERLDGPMVRMNGEWRIVDWQDALEIATQELSECIAEYGADKLGALASPNATLEEFYLLQKLIRALGSPHIDHRLREQDTSDQAALAAFPSLGMSLPELEQCEAILLIGSNIQKEQPLAATRLRKAIAKGASVMVVNPVDYAFNFTVTAKHIVAPHDMINVLTAIAEGTATSITQALKDKKKVAIILGALAMQHTHAAQIRAYAQKIATTYRGQLGFLTHGANSAGAWLAGAVPHRLPAGKALNQIGLSAYGMLEKPRKAYILLNVEPELDCANAKMAAEAMKQAKFILALSLYRNPVLEAHAKVILPIAPFTETAGTFVNAMGEWQSFKGTAKAFGSSRPAWKVLRVLANFLNLKDFEQQSAEAVRQEVESLVQNMPSLPIQDLTIKAQTPTAANITRVGEVPIYAVDSLTRHADPLQIAQQLMEGDIQVVRLHPDTAASLKITDGDSVRVKQHVDEVELPVVIDARVAIGAAWIASGIEATCELGDLMGPVEIKKC